MFQFLRRWYANRRLMHIKDSRGEKRKIYALIYAFSSWQLLGYIVYLIMKSNLPEGTSGANFIRAVYGVEDAKTIRITATTSVSNLKGTFNVSKPLDLEKEP